MGGGALQSEVVLSSDASAPLVAMAFKIQDHPTAGTLTCAASNRNELSGVLAVPSLGRPTGAEFLESSPGMLLTSGTGVACSRLYQRRCLQVKSNFPAYSSSKSLHLHHSLFCRVSKLLEPFVI